MRKLTVLGIFGTLVGLGIQAEVAPAAQPVSQTVANGPANCNVLVPAPLDLISFTLTSGKKCQFDGADIVGVAELSNPRAVSLATKMHGTTVIPVASIDTIQYYNPSSKSMVNVSHTEVLFAASMPNMLAFLPKLPTPAPKVSPSPASQTPAPKVSPSPASQTVASGPANCNVLVPAPVDLISLMLTSGKKCQFDGTEIVDVLELSNPQAVSLATKTHGTTVIPVASIDTIEYYNPSSKSMVNVSHTEVLFAASMPNMLAFLPKLPTPAPKVSPSPASQTPAPKVSPSPASQTVANGPANCNVLLPPPVDLISLTLTSGKKCQFDGADIVGVAELSNPRAVSLATKTHGTTVIPVVSIDTIQYYNPSSKSMVNVSHAEVLLAASLPNLWATLYKAK